MIEMDEFIERAYGDAEGMIPKVREATFPTGNYSNQEDRNSLNRRLFEAWT